jgi:hypothetical protein
VGVAFGVGATRSLLFDFELFTVVDLSDAGVGVRSRCCRF